LDGVHAATDDQDRSCGVAGVQPEPGRLVVQTDSRSRFQVFVIVEGGRPVVDDSGYA